MVNSVKNYNEQPLSTEAEWDSSFINNSPYAHDLLNKIEEVAFCSVDPIGITIALTGALGSGKSSIVKQTLQNLKSKYGDLVVYENNIEENSINDLEPTSNCLGSIKTADTANHNDGLPTTSKIDLNVFEFRRLVKRKLFNLTSDYCYINLIGNSSIGGLTITNKIKLHVSEFRCLWFQNDDALMLGFIEHLSAQISSIDKEVGKKFLKIAFHILRLCGVMLAQAYLAKHGITLPADIVETLAGSKKEPHESSASINELLSSLHKALEQKDAKESKKRILMVLDDLDRLDSTEVLAMFRLIKTFGNLPNIMFLLVYDNDIVSAIVEKHFPESKGKYLDKFIQLRVNMLPARKQSIVDQLKDSILKSCDIKECSYMADKLLNAGYFCSEQYIHDLAKMKQDESHESEMKDDEKQALDMFIVNTIIAHNLSNARDVSLIKNAVATSWEFCQHQISLSDILVIEIIKQCHKDDYSKVYSYTDLYNFSDGTYDKYDEDVHRTPFVCDWKYQITPISQSLSNPSLLSLYFFGSDYVESILKSRLPDFFSRLADVNYELISDNFNELLKALIRNMVVTELNSKAKDTTSLLYFAGDKSLFRYLDFVFTYFMIGRIDTDIANELINQLYLTIASKHFHELVASAINKTNDQDLSLSVAITISKWFARSIIDNEYYSTNRFFQNSNLIEQLASIKEKNVVFFLFLANFYRELANIRNSWHLDNAMKCYTIFYDTLQEQIVSGELLNLNYGCSLLVAVQDFISQIQNTNRELYEALKQSFIKIKRALFEKFSNKLVGAPFVLNLIKELQKWGNFDCIKHIDTTETRTKDEIIREIAKGFKIQFIDFYGIDITDVYDCVSYYFTKIDNDPNALNSLKEKAQMAFEVLWRCKELMSTVSIA